MEISQVTQILKEHNQDRRYALLAFHTLEDGFTGWSGVLQSLVNFGLSFECAVHLVDTFFPHLIANNISTYFDLQAEDQEYCRQSFQTVISISKDMENKNYEELVLNESINIRLNKLSKDQLEDMWEMFANDTSSKANFKTDALEFIAHKIKYRS